MADADALRDAGVPAIPVTPGSTPPPEAAPPTAPDGSVMTLIDHLGELRNRLFRSIFAVAIASTVGFLFFATPIRDFLIELLPPDPVGHHPQSRPSVSATRSSSSSGSRSSSGSSWRCRSCSTSSGRSSRPGLTPDEKKTVRPWIPLALFFFALGVVDRLSSCCRTRSPSCWPSTTEYLVQGIAAGPYFDFVTTMFLAFGLIMEFPIVHGRPLAGRDPDLGAAAGARAG